MIERTGSDCKYVDIFTHRVGSAGAPSTRTLCWRDKHNTVGTPKDCREEHEGSHFAKGKCRIKAAIVLNKESESR
jgi:hypothetical protein